MVKNTKDRYSRRNRPKVGSSFPSEFKKTLRLAATLWLDVALETTEGAPWDLSSEGANEIVFSELLGDTRGACSLSSSNATTATLRLPFAGTLALVANTSAVLPSSLPSGLEKSESPVSTRSEPEPEYSCEPPSDCSSMG